MTMNQQQQSIQLAHTASRGSSATQPNHNKDDAGLIAMCPSLYRAVHKGRLEEVMALLQQRHDAAVHIHQTMGNWKLLVDYLFFCFQ